MAPTEGQQTGRGRKKKKHPCAPPPPAPATTRTLPCAQKPCATETHTTIHFAKRDTCTGGYGRRIRAGRNGARGGAAPHHFQQGVRESADTYRFHHTQASVPRRPLPPPNHPTTQLPSPQGPRQGSTAPPAPAGRPTHPLPHPRGGKPPTHSQALSCLLVEITAGGTARGNGPGALPWVLPGCCLGAAWARGPGGRHEGPE